MILRKPYALLIKYFQKIHLVLLLLSAYIFYKTISLRNFVADFLETESYNSYYEPISDYINAFVILAIIAIVVITISLIVLLIYKKKPWKIYIVPIAEYIFMLGVLLYIANFFNKYDDYSAITSIMAGRDLLTIAYIIQYIIFIIFGMRFLGIDLKRFGFKDDEEYLSIKEEDREEVEINFEFDKDKITRNLKKLLRNLKYIYFEHRLICNTIIVIVVAVATSYTYYYFAIVNKTYQEGNTFTANYYDITVNNSYLTNRDSTGTIINKDSDNDYLVLNITVKNNVIKRKINIDRFRIMNKDNQFLHTSREYEYFKDLGSSYDKNKNLATGEEITFILVYKVSKNLQPNKYVLYYHDLSSNTLLKKIKLNVKDVRKLKTVSEANLNEEMKFEDNTTLTFTSAKLTTNTTYGAYSCSGNTCGPKDVPLTTTTSKILELSFISNNFSGQSFIDFSKIHAKIEYENNKGKSKSIIATSIVDDFYGNYAYFKIPNDIKENGNINIVFTFRDKRYVYHLK